VFLKENKRGFKKRKEIPHPRGIMIKRD